MRRRDYSPGKTKFDGGVTGCSGSYPDRSMTPLGYFCYPAPKPGYKCWLTACRSICPAWMEECGPGACALSAEACGMNIGQMVLDVTSAVISTASLVASFGTSGAGGTQVASSGVRSTLKNAAKNALSNFKKKLAKLATKAALKSAIKKKIIGVVESEIDVVVGLAAGAIVQEILGSTEKDMEEFDFTIFDPTGIASAVKTALEGGSSIDQAAAWTSAVGTFDPTGWVAAAATFMKGGCDVRLPP